MASNNNIKITSNHTSMLSIPKIKLYHSNNSAFHAQATPTTTTSSSKWHVSHIQPHPSNSIIKSMNASIYSIKYKTNSKISVNNSSPHAKIKIKI